MDKIFGIFGMITGSIGIIFSILSYKNNKMQAVATYFSNDKDLNFIEGRRIVYNLKPGEIVNESSPHRQKISFVLNTFHAWALLVKHKQLPLWVFYDKKMGITSSGIAVIRTYKKLQPTIQYYRKSNPKYAEYYEWLYNEILKKCTDKEIKEIIRKLK